MGSAFLKLHIEAPGTMYRHPNGDVSPSMAGHAWMELVNSDGKSIPAGFGPVETKAGVVSVSGRIIETDRESYAGDSYFTATYVITEGQAKAIERFIARPAEYGFDKDHYHAATNSCVDFVWKGLKQIGMNPTGFEGHTLPMANRDDFSTLKNPQIPGGGLISIATKDPIPVVAEPMMSPFSDWWGVAPAPWVSVSHIPSDDAHLPQGTITVGPLSPPIPVQQDGSNYADGTGYQ
nr:hypothetical protein [Herbaspirillum sp. ASV7]